MNNLMELIRNLVNSGKVRISEHGYDELVADGIFIRDAISGIRDWTLVEAYPNYP